MTLNCPNCRRPLSVATLRERFKCPHCGVGLACDLKLPIFWVSTIGFLSLWVFEGLLGSLALSVLVSAVVTAISGFLILSRSKLEKQGT